MPITTPALDAALKTLRASADRLGKTGQHEAHSCRAARALSYGSAEAAAGVGTESQPSAARVTEGMPAPKEGEAPGTSRGQAGHGDDAQRRRQSGETE